MPPAPCLCLRWVCVACVAAAQVPAVCGALQCCCLHCAMPCRCHPCPPAVAGPLERQGACPPVPPMPPPLLAEVVACNHV